MKESLLSHIYHHLFGYTYYINIYVRKSTNEVITSYPFPSRREAQRSRQNLLACTFIECIRFHSPNQYSSEGTLLNIEYEPDGSYILN